MKFWWKFENSSEILVKFKVPFGQVPFRTSQLVRKIWFHPPPAPKRAQNEEKVYKSVEDPQNWHSFRGGEDSPPKFRGRSIQNPLFYSAFWGPTPPKFGVYDALDTLFSPEPLSSSSLARKLEKKSRYDSGNFYGHFRGVDPLSKKIAWNRRGELNFMDKTKSGRFWRIVGARAGLLREGQTIGPQLASFPWGPKAH